jgi:hypothetical protein
MLATATIVCVALWAAPSIVPAREPALSPQAVVKNAKLNLYLASLRVREYHATNKRLPESLTEIGIDSTSIHYSRISKAHFELSSHVQGSAVTYKSSVPDSVFLGENVRIHGIN